MFPWQQENDLLAYMRSLQPTAAQSLASAIPFLNLPKKQAAFYQPFQNTVNAIGDMDNPQFQKLFKQKRQAGQQNLAEFIAETQRQNRKASALGRTPLFDSERGGEVVFRNLMRGYDDVQNRAMGDTEDTLGKLASLQSVVAGQQAQLAGNKAGIQGNLQGALVKLFGL